MVACFVVNSVLLVLLCLI